MAGYIEQVEQWRALVQRQIQFVEDYLGCQVILDENVLAEIVSHTESILAKQCPDFTPNIAKRAGVFVFWFRKLKPISYPPEANNWYLPINEFVALMVGLAMCEEYKDDFSKPGFTVASIEPRLLQDWVNSLRVHSHSPNSTVMSFELIATGRQAANEDKENG